MSDRLWVGPTGRAIAGHVLDCAKIPLERKLREYDECLYLKWNAKKLHGWGCWELRRRPEKKSVRETLCYGGNTYTVLEYKELDLVNHVLDLPFLNYSVLEKLKGMDTWQESYRAKDFVHNLEYREAKAQEKIDQDTKENLAYSVKQYKREIRDFKEFVNSGHNPARIADYWGKK